MRRLRAEEPDLDLNTVEDLQKIPAGSYGRRGLHDDITVIVIVYDTPDNFKGNAGSMLPLISQAQRLS